MAKGFQKYLLIKQHEIEEKEAEEKKKKEQLERAERT